MSYPSFLGLRFVELSVTARGVSPGHVYTALKVYLGFIYVVRFYSSAKQNFRAL